MAISIYPQFYDALFNLRDTYLELGNKTGADECSAIMKNLLNLHKTLDLLPKYG